MTNVDAWSNAQSADLPKGWLDFARPADQGESAFAAVLAEALRLSLTLRLPKTVSEEASKLCGQAFKKSATRGSSLQALASAAVYASCRMVSFGLTVEEVAEVTGIPRADIVRTFRKLQRRLKLNIPAPSVDEYLPRMVTSLKLSQSIDIVELASQNAVAAQRLRSAQGRNPSALAAGCVYLAASELGIHVTHRQLAKSSFVAENTIRRTCAYLHVSLPNALSANSPVR